MIAEGLQMCLLLLVVGKLHGEYCEKLLFKNVNMYI